MRKCMNEKQWMNLGFDAKIIINAWQQQQKKNIKQKIDLITSWSKVQHNDNYKMLWKQKWNGC